MRTNYMEELLFFADIVHTTSLEVQKSFNGGHKYSVQLKDCELKETPTDACLASANGYGYSVEEACEDYFQKISNNLLVFHAYKAIRSEFHFDTLHEQYKQYKQDELASKITYEVYSEILEEHDENPDPEHTYVIDDVIHSVIPRIIKGETLYEIRLIGHEGKIPYFLYEVCNPAIAQAKTKDRIHLHYIEDDAGNFIVVQCYIESRGGY